MSYRLAVTALRERVRTLEKENAKLHRVQTRCAHLEDVIAELRLEPEEPIQTRTSRLGSALFVSSMPLALAQQWWWFAAVALVGATMMCWHSPPTPDVKRDPVIDPLKDFDAAARRAVVVGQQLTRRLGHERFTAAHLLLALVRNRNADVIRDAQALVLDLPKAEFVGISGGLSAHFAIAELAARAEEREVRIIDLWHALATDPSPDVAHLAATHAPS